MAGLRWPYLWLPQWVAIFSCGAAQHPGVARKRDLACGEAFKHVLHQINMHHTLAAAMAWAEHMLHALCKSLSMLQGHWAPSPGSLPVMQASLLSHAHALHVVPQVTGCQHAQASAWRPRSTRLGTGTGLARGPAELRSARQSRQPQRLLWRLRGTGRSSKRRRACRVRALLLLTPYVWDNQDCWSVNAHHWKVQRRSLSACKQPGNQASLRSRCVSNPKP